MLRVLRLIIVSLVGASLGLGSVWFALTDPRLDGSPAIGPWRVPNGTGTAPSDPYARARIARAGTAGLGAAEGLAFVAAADSAGEALSPSCHYAIEGDMPPGELWTLTVTDRAGRPAVNPANRTGFTSRDVIRRSDGAIAIVVGREARPGNFVPIGALESVVITLRVYASGLSARPPRADELPDIRRLDCAGAEPTS